MEYSLRFRNNTLAILRFVWARELIVLCGSALRIYILIILHLGIVCIGNRGSATSRAFFSTLNLSLRAACGFLLCLFHSLHFFLAFLTCRRHFGSPLNYDAH